MKKHLLSHVGALCMLAPVWLLSLPAAAAPRGFTAVAPQTRGLEVNADNGVAPGSQLRFTLEATPGGQASVRVPGLDAAVGLKEVAPGQYSGRYTVRGMDRIDPAAVIKVSLISGGRTSLANYTFPPSFMSPVVAAPARPPLQARPTVVAPPLVVVQPAAAPLRIERFAMAPMSRVEPGSEMQFQLDGMPGATAWFDIPGVVSRAPMREMRSGHYEGSYTVRRQDNLGAAGPITATLRSADYRVAVATLSLPMLADHRPPQIANLLPRQGEAVAAGSTLVSGSLDDANGTGVDS